MPISQCIITIGQKSLRLVQSESIVTLRLNCRSPEAEPSITTEQVDGALVEFLPIVIITRDCLWIGVATHHLDLPAVVPLVECPRDRHLVRVVRRDLPCL